LTPPAITVHPSLFTHHPSPFNNMPSTKSAWPDQVHRVLREQHMRQIAYVPDSGHKRLIELVRADRQMRAALLGAKAHE
jgi:hypothetical protein